MLLNVFVLVATFFFMEFVAWFAHKYIMHGFLWHLHRDHHTKESEHILEKNDYFFLIFATPGALGLFAGSFFNIPVLFWFGAGVTVYGFTYFLIHDVVIHQRIKWFRRSNNTYIKAIRKAHKVHHKHLTKEDGECFGMLVVPFKYFKQVAKNA